ncbi:MAG: ribonuclease HI [Candidatus Omnitrophica bacterium]|nr:ribonuclease HI [Candidatus Omnitrophota bacterium]
MGRNDTITLYTDGACSGNPGPEGWAAILKWRDHQKELSGFEAATTNNRMELRAVIEGLKAIKNDDYPVQITTDSRYIHDAFIKDWISGWKRKGWKTSQKTDVKNRDLWEELIDLVESYDVEWAWTKGHAEDELNNRCDELARGEVEKRRG